MSTPDDLVEPEGVDGGSAAATAERGGGGAAGAGQAGQAGEAAGAAVTAARSLGTGLEETAASGAARPPGGDLLGPPADVDDPVDGERRAAPVDVATPEEHAGPGQQYQVGEG